MLRCQQVVRSLKKYPTKAESSVKVFYLVRRFSYCVEFSTLLLWVSNFQKKRQNGASIVRVVTIPGPLLEVILCYIQQWFSRLLCFTSFNSILRMDDNCGPVWTHKGHRLSGATHAVKTNEGFIPWGKRRLLYKIIRANLVWAHRCINVASEKQGPQVLKRTRQRKECKALIWAT